MLIWIPPNSERGVPAAEKASSTFPTQAHFPPCALFHGSFPANPPPLVPGTAGRCCQSALHSGYCTYSFWQLAQACINYLDIVYSKKGGYEIYNYCFQGHNRYVGVRTGVSCYSQRKKILYISLRHSVCGGRAAQMVQIFIYEQKEGGWKRDEYTKASSQLTVPCKKHNTKWRPGEKTVRLDYMIFKGPFHHKPFHDSMITRSQVKIMTVQQGFYKGTVG